MSELQSELKKSFASKRGIIIDRKKCGIYLVHTGSKIFWLSIYGNIELKGQGIVRGGGEEYQCYQNYHINKGWIHNGFLGCCIKKVYIE